MRLRGRAAHHSAPKCDDISSEMLFLGIDGRPRGHDGADGKSNSVVVVGDRRRACCRAAGLQVDERLSRRAPLGGK
jgi:hypothetical protein